jgi:hypothetical protein
MLFCAASLHVIMNLRPLLTVQVVWDSAVGIATRYWLEGPVIKSWWGRDFPHPHRLALGPTQPPIQWVPVSFPGVKRPGRGVYLLTSTSARVKEGVELYFYCPSGPSWPILRRTLLYLTVCG